MTGRRYPNLSESYEANFREFRRNPLRERHWYCRHCKAPNEDHWGDVKQCPWSPTRFQMMDVEEELTWRNERWDPVAKGELR